MFQGINIAKDRAPAEVSGDGKRLTSRSIDGHIRWMKCAPSVEEWSRLAKYPLTGNLEHGRFQWLDESKGIIYAVFRPYCGLDFNLVYIADTGELINIHEAR